CQRYINIEKFRLGERLNVEWKFGRLPNDLRIPALTLQPLVENAIYHGIEPSAERGTVRLTVDYDGREVRIVITNPLAPAPAHSRGNRMAVGNIRQRLTAHYGPAAKLAMHADAGLHTTFLSYPLDSAEYAGRNAAQEQEARSLT
ncbi:MAG: sensor histidine kinase, partial [Moraxellaceae bacterium]